MKASGVLPKDRNTGRDPMAGWSTTSAPEMRGKSMSFAKPTSCVSNDEMSFDWLIAKYRSRCMNYYRDPTRLGSL